MHIKKLDDSKVDEIIKKIEAQHSVSPNPKEEKVPGDAAVKTVPKIKLTKELGNLIIIFILLALTLVQSVELINLRNQLKNGQFGGIPNTPAAGGAQGLPAQQGGC